jgi:hypothetical protein
MPGSLSPAEQAPRIADPTSSTGPLSTADVDKYIRVVREGPLNVEYPEFGASPAATPATNAAAINAAITKAKNALGGTVLIPRMGYRFNAQLNLDLARGVQLEGTTGPSGLARTAAQAALIYTGAGSASAISAKGSTGVGIRKLAITYTGENGVFNGNLIDLGGVSAGGDTGYGAVEDCELFGASGAVVTAKSLINLNQSIICWVKGCQLSHANIGILMQEDTYSNAHQIENTTFLRLAQAGVRNSGQAVLFKGCTFEPLTNDAAGAYEDTANSYGPVMFMGCWFGDTAVASTRPWIRYRGNALTLIGNYIGNPGAAGVPVALIGNGQEAVRGVTAVGNYFDGATVLFEFVAGQQVLSFTAMGNIANGTPTLRAGVVPTQESVFGNQGFADSIRTTNGVSVGATASLVGFWGNNPVAKPTAVADASGGTTIDTQARTQLNALLSRLRTIGIITT